MLVLALDASTYTGTVALLRDGAQLAACTVAMRGAHEERLMPAVRSTLAEGGVSVADLDAVAVGGGPGSFTSLRIAGSIAKGLAVARNIPLITAPSPLLVLAGADPVLAAGSYLAALDAMRGDVFILAADIDPQGRLAMTTEPSCIPRPAAEARAAALGATLVGPGETRRIDPHARGFALLLSSGLGRAVDAATWEPDYGRKAEAQVRWEQAHGRPLERA